MDTLSEKKELIFENAITNIAESIGSLFTKDDVIVQLKFLRHNLTLAEAEEQTNPYATANDLDELEKNIINALDDHGSRNGNSELVDYSSAEFSLNYDNRIEIENIDLNHDSIAATIIEYITNK